MTEALGRATTPFRVRELDLVLISVTSRFQAILKATSKVSYNLVQSYKYYSTLFSVGAENLSHQQVMMS